jgi:hypothetical protein
VDLAEELGVPRERIIVRHGVDQERQREMTGVLPPELVAQLEPERHATLSEAAEWPGGYFGFKGPEARPDSEDDIKRTWRKEHLPDATELVASSFCSAVAGRLGDVCVPGERLRVTLHRVLYLERERLLQQCCDYLGLEDGKPLVGASGDTAGRTFTADAGTIGLACKTASVVQTRPGSSHAELEADMQRLHLNSISRTMSSAVRSLAAVPLMSRFGSGAQPVAVLYIDSTREDALGGDALAEIVAMCQGFLVELKRLGARSVGRIGNYEFWGRERDTYAPATVDAGLRALQKATIEPPVLEDVPFLNFEITDFARVGNA